MNDWLYLLNKFNGWKQVQTKVNEVPLNAFTFVFFLLKDKHVVIKELLKFLICQINAQLLKCVELQEEPNKYVKPLESVD